MAKTIEPVTFYSHEFQKSWGKLYKEIENEDGKHARITIDFLDKLSQLLDELAYAEIQRTRKESKKSKKK